ncbi:hypothetical protein HGRIS_012016 [Hohenbuehelia grisea]|uniref:Uncharacterized protein n=1 Tax=Hohenbuehelia grisea TaxID=104357 RepID=A0ABR3IP51_9AGAR
MAKTTPPNGDIHLRTGRSTTRRLPPFDSSATETPPSLKQQHLLHASHHPNGRDGATIKDTRRRSPERASLSIQTLDQRLQHVLAQQERYPSIDSCITAQTSHSPVSTDIPTESDHAADPPSPDSPSLEYLTPPEYPSDDNSHLNQTSTSQVLLLSTMPTDTVPNEVNDQRGSVTAGPMLPRTRIFDIGPLDRTTPFSHLGYGPEFELSYATSTERARIAEGHTPRIRPGVLTSGQTQVISRLRSEDGTERLELNMLNANLLLQNTDSRVLASFPCHAHITAIIPPEDMDMTFPFEAPMIAQEALHAALVEAGNAYVRSQSDTRSMLELIERQLRMSRILDDPDTDTEAVEEHQPSDEPLTPPGMTPLPDEPHIDLAPTPRSTYVNVLTTTPESQVSSLPYIHSPSAIRRQAQAHAIPAHAPLDPIFVHPLAAADPAAEHQGLPVAGDLEEILAQQEAEFNKRRSTGSPVPMRVVSRHEQELLSCQQQYAQEHHDRLPIYQTPEPRTRRTLSSYNYRSRSESPRLSLGRGPRHVSVSSESDSDMDTQTQTVPPFDDSVMPGPALASINVALPIPSAYLEIRPIQCPLMPISEKPEEGEEDGEGDEEEEEEEGMYTSSSSESPETNTIPLPVLFHGGETESEPSLPTPLSPCSPQLIDRLR